MENVETFLDQLIDEKGLGVEGEVRNQLKLDMMERLLDQIDRASINALPEDKAIELADKLDDPDFGDDQIAEFIKNSGVDLERVALETMLQFRLLYLGGNENVNTDAMAEETTEETAEGTQDTDNTENTESAE